MISNRDRLAGALLERDHPDDWHSLAACQGMHKLFDIDIGSHAARAKRICADCPVRRQCLNEAMLDEGGIWKSYRACVRGGLTPKERYELYRCSIGSCGHEKGHCP